MKLSHLASFALGALTVLGVGTITQSKAQAPAHIYQFRRYYANPGKLEDLKKRFRDHTIEIFNRHHMKSVGYWEPTDNKDNALFYLLEFPNEADGVKNWKEFQADPEWKKVAAASEEHGKLVDHVESFYMAPSDFSPMK